MRRARGAWLVAASLLLASACTPPAEHEGEGAAEGGGSSSTAWVEVEGPSDASLVELPAQVVAAAESRSRLSAPFPATVVGAEVRVGDRVEVGDPIVELRMPAVLEAAAILAGASAQLGSHKQRRDRLADLQKKGLVGAGEVFDVEAGMGRLSADRRLALATLKAAGLSGAEDRREVLRRGTVILKSPISGVVAELDAVPSDVVDPGESLAPILGRGPARIEVAHSGALPPVLELEFVGLDGSRFALDPTPVSTAVEPGLGRLLAWYEPQDGRELPDGVRGRVLISSVGEGMLEVPRRALRMHEGKAWVARRSEDGGAELVEVEVLRSAGSSALILAVDGQLHVGDRVASDAATVLGLGREGGGEGGHHH